jgi:hypothetical protein
VGADGPSPSPVSPWHLAQPFFRQAISPRARSSGVSAGVSGTASGSPGPSSRKRGEKPFTCASTAQRSSSGSQLHGIMAEPCMPREMERKRSSSVGSEPVGVDRISNTPFVKSRAGTSKRAAWMPLPLPFTPWHGMQRSR